MKELLMNKLNRTSLEYDVMEPIERGKRKSLKK